MILCPGMKHFHMECVYTSPLPESLLSCCPTSFFFLLNLKSPNNMTPGIKTRFILLESKEMCIGSLICHVLVENYFWKGLESGNTYCPIKWEVPGFIVGKHIQITSGVLNHLIIEPHFNIIVIWHMQWIQQQELWWIYKP